LWQGGRKGAEFANQLNFARKVEKGGKREGYVLGAATSTPEGQREGKKRIRANGDGVEWEDSRRVGERKLAGVRV